MLPPRRPAGPRDRAAGRSAPASARGAPAVQVDAAARATAAARAARPHAASAAPARAQPVGHGLLGRAARDPARRRPPDRPHLLQPAAGAAAGRRARAGRPAPAGADHLHRARCERRGSCDLGARAARPRRSDHRPRRADRRTLPHARAPRRADPRLIAGQPRTPTRSPRSCGERRRHPGLPDALGGARATSTCCCATGWSWKRSATASCAVSRTR